MWAYYQYQYKTEKKEGILNPYKLGKIYNNFSKTIGRRKETWFGMKFLESFYCKNAFTLSLLYLLKENQKMIVNTVCDYDVENTFSFQKKFDEDLNLDEKEKEKIFDIIYQVDIKGKKNFCKAEFENGIIVCHKRKEYIILKEFFKKRGYVVDPLALLTRSSKNSQGGGDFDVEYLPTEDFLENKYFNEDLVTAWKDRELTYLESLEEIPNNYKNISKEILIIEKL